MPRALLIALILMLPLIARGKGGDTSVWKQFELIASKGSLHNGTQKINLPRESSVSLADMLNRYSALFIKHYGPGGLASTSMRGLGAQHTAVLWNGINLQSVMNSNFDLNLMPSFFLDATAIETGAGSAACGSGSLAGAIVLQNSMISDKRVFAELGAGSFGKYDIGAGFTLGKGSLRSRTRFIYKGAENNYSYANVFLQGSPVETMRNNRFAQKGIMQEFSLKLKGTHQLYANILLLETSRQLPPVMGSTANMKESQNDANRIVLVKHEGSLGRHYKLSNKLAFLMEKIDYFNALLSPAFNASHGIVAESELKRQVGAIDVTASANCSYQYAETDGYRQGITRWLTSAYLSAKWAPAGRKYKVFASGRQVLHSSKRLPFTPELAAEYKLTKKVQLKTNASASYRIPSFNDLYWQPGGNPLLQPEKGRKIEASAELKLSRLKAGLSVFRHRVDNWILWQPASGTGVWMATNTRQVNSTGFECALDGRLKTGTLAQLRLFGRYQYVKSINTLVYGSDQLSAGKQPVYTPNHTASGTIQYLWRAYRIQAGAVYTGRRFTTASNNAVNALPGFAVCNASLSKEVNIQSLSAVLEISVFNVFNTTYTVVENRPMPLRHFLIILKFNIQNDK